MEDSRPSTKESKSDWVDQNGQQHVAAAAMGESPAAFVYLRPWHQRFGNQFVALFWKNLLVNWRNFRATLLRILAPL
jgi:hypothetical protein